MANHVKSSGGWHGKDGKDEDDLIDDLDTLAGLEATGPAEQIKRSMARTYRFPQQETKLRGGRNATVPVVDGPPATVSIQDMDRTGREITVTDAGLLAIGIEPVVVKTVVAIRKYAAETSAPTLPAATRPKLRTGTKQALLIAMLQVPEGATMEEITAATGWQAHTAR